MQNFSDLHLVFIKIKLLLVYLLLDVLDSLTNCSDLISSLVIWNLDIEMSFEIHDKLYDVK